MAVGATDGLGHRDADLLSYDQFMADFMSNQHFEPVRTAETPDFNSLLFLPSTHDENSPDTRFHALQKELRSVLFAGVPSLVNSREVSPLPIVDSVDHGIVATASLPQEPDFGRTSIPKLKLIKYLAHWITDSAPCLDKFDEAQHFAVQIPLLATRSPTLLHAILAFSARHLERKSGYRGNHDSLELYQESIRLLGADLQARDPNTVAVVCVLACLELMSDSSSNWRRHLGGCAALIGLFNVHGFYGGLLQAVFWSYARMDLCGAIHAHGSESTVLHIDRWIAPEMVLLHPPEQRQEAVRQMFEQRSLNSIDMFGNWAVYLCAQATELCYRRTKVLGSQQPDRYDSRPFEAQWSQLWNDLNFWYNQRPPAMRPITLTSENHEERLFPDLLFVHRAAISANQAYHTAGILMLEVQPAESDATSPQELVIWHARRVCGISLTNPHRGNLSNAIQPLCLAGRYFTHIDEHKAIVRLLNLIHESTGFGARSRIRELEIFWGYEPGTVSSKVAVTRA